MFSRTQRQLFSKEIINDLESYFEAFEPKERKVVF